MEMYVWLMVMTYQAEWRYVSMVHGAQYVMTFGILRMLEWFADNLDYQLDVRIIIVYTQKNNFIFHVCMYILLKFCLLAVNVFFCKRLTDIIIHYSHCVC